MKSSRLHLKYLGIGILKSYLETIAAQFSIELRVVFTDGTQPVGRGIGPALEAKSKSAGVELLTPLNTYAHPLNQIDIKNSIIESIGTLFNA